MLRKKEDEKYFKIAVTGVAILLIGMVCFFLFYRIRGFGAFCWTMGLILVMAIADGLYSYQVAKADEAEAQEGNI